jgi:hypothetical protein
VNAVPAAFHADWVRLWALAQRVAAPTGEEPDYVFLDIGLRLEDPAAPGRDGGYRSSPVNATMFASTGGDGVHFSVLHTAHAAGGPVVMTAPAAFDGPNLVVGDGLPEFLALGCRTAYDGLDLLRYRRQHMIARLETAEPRRDTEEAGLLQLLIDEFDLRPWRNVEQRLDELDTRYGSQIQLDEHDPSR